MFALLPLLLVPPVGWLVYWLMWRSSMAEIELHPGTPFCSAAMTLNRIARQQGLCLAIAQASIFDEICQAWRFPATRSRTGADLLPIRTICANPNAWRSISSPEAGNEQDLAYFATKQERLHRFQQLLFAEDVELRFLARKTDLDKFATP